jgi:hypothetical protein
MPVWSHNVRDDPVTAMGPMPNPGDQHPSLVNWHNSHPGTVTACPGPGAAIHEPK